MPIWVIDQSNLLAVRCYAYDDVELVEVPVNDPVVGQPHHQVHQLVVKRPGVRN